MGKVPLSIKVKDARESQGMTQYQLAQKMGVSQPYVGKIESGKVNPSLKTLDKLSKALNVDQKYFLEENQGVFFDEYKDELSLKENQLIREAKFRPWIALAADCTKDDITTDEIRELINIALKFKKDKTKTP